MSRGVAVRTSAPPPISGPELLRAVMPSPSAIALGTDVQTGEALSLPVTSLTRNIFAEAETGQGKTGTAQELGFSFPFSPMSMVFLDYIGTGFDWSMRFVAFMATVLRLLEDLEPLLAGSADWFLRRHAFGVISYREESDVKIDILKRRRRPDGMLESVAEVVERLLSVFSVRFPDMNVRVRFRRVATAVFTALCAGARSISEYRPILGDALFRAFVSGEIARLGTDGDPFVREQLAELDRIVALSPRAFEEQTESFFNALQDYAPGTALGSMFGSEETFDPSLCAFGDARMFFTTDLANPLLRREAFLSLHALMQSLFTLRRQGTGEYSRCFYVLDECAQWAEQTLFTLLAMGRNLKVSTFLLFQSMAQWKDAGFQNAAEILPSVCRLQGVWRPSSVERAKELAFRARPTRPMDELYVRELASIAKGKNLSDTVTESWADTQSHAETDSYGSGWSNQYGTNNGFAYDALGMPTGTSVGDGFQSGQTESWNRGSTEGYATTRGGANARAIGKAITKTLAETMFRIPFEEQLAVHAQNLLRRPEHQATWLYEGKSIDVDMYPPREYPRTLLGLPIDAWYADWRTRYYRSRAEKRAVFQQTPILVAARPAIAAAPMETSASPATPNTSTAPSTSPTSSSPEMAELTRPGTPTPIVARVETGAFPAIPLADKGLARTLAVLQLAHVARPLTVHGVMALSRWSYDKAYRALDACADAAPPLLDRIRPFAPRGQGSAPTLYILSTAGARLLAAHGGDERVLLRIAKNGAEQRRAIEEHLPHQGRHRAYGSTLLVFLAAAAARAGLRVTDVRGDREVFENIDLAPYYAAMTDREPPDPTKPIRYVPDLPCPICHSRVIRRYFLET